MSIRVFSKQARRTQAVAGADFMTFCLSSQIKVNGATKSGWRWKEHYPQ